MVFGNLLKPPHVKRFLLALLAGSVAIIVYFTADHFQVVPGTAALDEEIPDPPVLGERSVLVVPDPGDCSDDSTLVLALEIIRQLTGFSEIQVISPHSALAPGFYDQAPGPERPVIETNWQLRISCTPEADGSGHSASLVNTGTRLPSWESSEFYESFRSQEFIADVMRGVFGHFGLGLADSQANPIPDTVFNDYLYARWLLHSDPSRSAEAKGLLDRALEAWPDWAPALTARAIARLLQPAVDAQTAEQQIQATKSGLLEAISQDPAQAEAHLYLSIIAHRLEWDWEQAYDSATKALEFAPGDAAVLAAASTAAFTLGKI